MLSKIKSKSPIWESLYKSAIIRKHEDRNVRQAISATSVLKLPVSRRICWSNFYILRQVRVMASPQSGHSV